MNPPEPRDLRDLTRNNFSRPKERQTIRWYHPNHHRKPITSIQVVSGRLLASAGLYSHKPNQVADAVINYIRDPPDSAAPMRLRAFDTYRHLVESAPPPLPTPPLLQSFFRACDDLFFFSALHAHTAVELATAPSADGQAAKLVSWRNARVDHSANGRAWLELPIGTECRITVFPRREDHRGRGDGTSGWKKWPGSLLRQMAHAMLDLYTCGSHGSCVRQHRVREGEGGNLGPFQRIMREVEEVTGRMPGGKVDTGRLVVLGVDVAARVDCVSGKQLRAWGLDEDEFWDLVEMLRREGVDDGLLMRERKTEG